MAYLYILECEGNTLYTGITTDIEKRMGEHRARGSRCAKYTRAHPMKCLVALWETDTYNHARKGEYAVKRLSRRKKDQLVAHPELLTELCPNLAETEFKPLSKKQI